MKTKVEYQPGITEVDKLICEKYWLRESDKRNGYVYTCKQLGQEFGLKHSEISVIAKRNAHLVVLDCQCLECGKAKICFTRGDLTQLKIDSWRCDKCWEILRERRMQLLLQQSLEQERLEEERKQNILKYLNGYRRGQLSELKPFATLNEVDKLLLAATIKSLGAEDLRKTISLRNNLSLALSPFFKLDEHILRHLFNLNLLLIDPEESYEHVTINSEQKLDIDYHQATFEFAYDVDNLTKVLIAAKANKDISRLVNNVQFESWCQRIQLEECLSYLVTRAKLNDLAPPVGDKLLSLLRTCLAECSVSVMHYIIWKAVESAAAYVQKPNITRKHASNSISGNIERIFDKISNGIWYPNKSYRDSSHPQSAIAKIFFDYVFGIDDCGFYYTLDELFSPYKTQQTLGQANYSKLGTVRNANYSIKIDGLEVK